jgi:hypothetical protein
MRPHHSSLSIPSWAVPLLGGLVVLGLVGFVLLGGTFSPSSEAEDSGCVDVNRSAYGVSPSVFAQLPSPPACLVSISSAFESGKFSDAFFFTPEYYLQPEFYPNFQSEGLPQWTSPLASHFGLVGISLYPFESRSGVLKGGEKSFRFFIHSGYGVRSTQAVRLEAVLEDSSGAQYVSLSLDPESSSGFILDPTFPLFSSNWVHPVVLTVQMDEHAPYTEYRIHLRTVPVSDDFFTSNTPTGTSLYYDSTTYVGSRILNTLTVVPS